MSRQPRVFISRTTNGLAATADKCAVILNERGYDVIHQPDFTASWLDVKKMLQGHLIDCDAVICLVGPACGLMMREPIKGLKDARTEGRHFSYTQLEMLVARDLPRPVFTYLCCGSELIAPLKPETVEQAKCQEDFITEFAKDGSNTRVPCDTWAKLEDDLRRIIIPRTVSAGKPCNLPYATLGTLFKGREDFIHKLRTSLTSGSATVIKGHAISGMGGIGKTRTAIEYAWQYAEHYNALIFLNADSSQNLHRSLAQLCGALILNLPEQDASDQKLQVAAALAWLQRHPGWLTIIDNADDDDSLAEVEKLVANLSAGHCLITSRLTDYSGNITSLDLYVLADKDAAAFLLERTADHRTTTPDDLAAALALARHLDGLALALEQAAAYIRRTRSTFAAYLTRWQTHTAETLQWHDAKKMHYPRSLAVTFEISITQLSTDGIALLHIFSWFAADAIPTSILDMEGVYSGAHRLLADLENLSLARRREDGVSFSIHRVIQEILRQQQIKNGALVGLQTALDWIHSRVAISATDPRSWNILTPIIPHAHCIGTFAHFHAILTPTARVLNQVALYFKTKARFNESAALYEKVLAIDAKTAGPASLEYANSLNNYGQLLETIGKSREAEGAMRHALSILESNPQARSEELAGILGNYGRLLQSAGRFPEAEEKLRRALNLFQKTYGRQDKHVAICLSNLGVLMQSLERGNEAVTLMREALVTTEACYGPDHPEVAVVLNNFAFLLVELKRLPEAEEMLCRALTIDEKEFGEMHPKIATRLNNLSQILASTGRHNEAVARARRVLAIDEAAFEPMHPNIGTDAMNLGVRLLELGNKQEAAELLDRALRIFVFHSMQSNHLHPHLKAAIHNYRGLLIKMGETKAQVDEKIEKMLAPIVHLLPARL